MAKRPKPIFEKVVVVRNDKPTVLVAIETKPELQVQPK